MPKFKREYSIALVVIGGIVLLIFGVNYLKGLDLLQKRDVYYAVYTDVSGVTDASPVLFHGYKVGQVIGTDLVPDGSGRIAVEFQLDEDRLKLPSDTRIEIYSSDLFTRAIQINLGTSTTFAPQGDTLVGDVKLSLTESISAQLDPLKQKAEGMVATIDSILGSLQGILHRNGRGNIDATFNSLRDVMDNLKNTTQRLDALLASESVTIKSTLGNLDKVSGTLAAHSKDLGRIFSNVDSLTASLANGELQKTITNLGTTSDQLRQMMQKMNEGQGTLGKLVKDDSLYHNLNDASRELAILLEDLHTNPNRYLSIFGKKDKLPKLSEADIERIQQAYQKQHATKP